MRKWKKGAIAAGAAAVILTGAAGCAQTAAVSGDTASGTDSQVETGAGQEAREQVKYEILLPMQTESGQWGYVNLDGDMVIFPVYDEAGAFTSDGFAYVRTGNQAGYIDRSGKWVLGPKERDDYFRFDKITQLSVNAEAIAKAGFETLQPQEFKICGKWGTVGMDGRVRIPFLYDELTKCEGTEQLLYSAAVNDPVSGEYEKYGILNGEGKELTPFEYDYLENSFSLGLMVFEKDGGYGYMDETGDTVIAPVYSDAGQFHENSGLAIVSKRGYWGLIDREGDEVLPAEYEYLEVPYYMENKFEKTQNPIYFLYDEDDNIQIYNAAQKQILPGLYEDAAAFSAPDFVIVSKNGKYGVIDGLGETVAGFNYEYIGTPQEDGSVQARKSNGKWGMLNYAGETVIEFKYDTLGAFNEFDLASAEVGGKTGCLNREGEAVIPFEYDFIDWVLPEEIPAAMAEKISERTASGKSGFLMCAKENHMQFLDLDGGLIYEFSAPEDAEVMEETEALLFLSDMLKGFCDSLGYEIDAAGKDLIDYFVNSYYEYADDVDENTIFYDYDSESYGLKDRQGKVIVKPSYDDMNYTNIEGVISTEKYDEGRAEYLQGAVYYEEGRLYQIEPEYVYLDFRESGIIAASEQDTSILMNKYGDWLIRLDNSRPAEQK